MEAYLVRKRKPRVAHIWIDTDTACRMYSTGGLMKKKYIVAYGATSLPICTMCGNVMMRDSGGKDAVLLALDHIANAGK